MTKLLDAAPARCGRRRGLAARLGLTAAWPAAAAADGRSTSCRRASPGVPVEGRTLYGDDGLWAGTIVDVLAPLAALRVRPLDRHRRRRQPVVRPRGRGRRPPGAAARVRGGDRRRRSPPSPSRRRRWRPRPTPTPTPTPTTHRHAATATPARPRRRSRPSRRCRCRASRRPRSRWWRSPRRGSATDCRVVTVRVGRASADHRHAAPARRSPGAAARGWASPAACRCAAPSPSRTARCGRTPVAASRSRRRPGRRGRSPSRSAGADGDGRDPRAPAHHAPLHAGRRRQGPRRGRAVRRASRSSTCSRELRGTWRTFATTQLSPRRHVRAPAARGAAPRPGA